MLVTKYNTSFKVVESSNLNFWSTYYQSWENDTFNFIMPRLNTAKTFVDVGAWIGPISLVASQHSSKCICFEPDEFAYKELCENIELNEITNIVVENLAVSPNPQIRLGAPELGTSVTREDCDTNAKVYECITMASVFEKYGLTESNVSVLKIDVEGHESELLKDKFLWDLNIPMHISLHPGYKNDIVKYYSDIMPFFDHKRIRLDNYNVRDFFDVYFD